MLLSPALQLLPSLFPYLSLQEEQQSVQMKEIKRNSSVRSVCYLPGKKQIAISFTTTIQILNLSPLNEAVIDLGKESDRHEQEINSISVSSSERYLASGADDNLIKYWDLNKNELIYSFEAFPGLVYCVKFSSDESKVIACSYTPIIKIFSFPEGEILSALQGHRAVIMCLAVDRNFTRCLSASWDHSCRVWNLSSNSCERILLDHSGECNAVDISSNGKFGATGADDGKVFLYDLNTGSVLSRFSGHTKMVVGLSLRMASDNRFIVSSASWDGTVRVYEKEGEGRIVARHNHKVATVYFTPHGEVLFTGSFDGTSRIIDLCSEDRERVFLLIPLFPREILQNIRYMLFW